MRDIHKIKWLHLGNSKLDKKYYKNIRNHSFLNKPEGGIWISPYTPDDEHVSAWHKFIDYSGMSASVTQGTLITFKENTKIYVINSYEDLIRISVVEQEDEVKKNICEKLNIPYERKLLVDFETLSKSYDVLYLTEVGEMITRNIMLQASLYGWDFECAVIFNYDCIESQEPFYLKGK